MEKSYEAPKLLVAEGEIYESIAAGIASAVTSSATSSMTSCGGDLRRIESEITTDRSTFTITPVLTQLPAAEAAVAPVAPVAPAKLAGQ